MGIFLEILASVGLIWPCKYISSRPMSNSKLLSGESIEEKLGVESA